MNNQLSNLRKAHVRNETKRRVYFDQRIKSKNFGYLPILLSEDLFNSWVVKDQEKYYKNLVKNYDRSIDEAWEKYLNHLKNPIKYPIGNGLLDYINKEKN